MIDNGQAGGKDASGSKRGGRMRIPVAASWYRPRHHSSTSSSGLSSSMTASGMMSAFCRGKNEDRVKQEKWSRER